MSHSATLRAARGLARHFSPEQRWLCAASSPKQTVDWSSYRRHSSCACQQPYSCACRSRQRCRDPVCAAGSLQPCLRGSAASQLAQLRPSAAGNPQRELWPSSCRSFHTGKAAFAPSTTQVSASSSSSSSSSSPSSLPPPASASPATVSMTHPPLAPPGQSVPIPASHLLLFQQGALPSPDAIVSPTPRVLDVFSELQALSQYEMLQLQNVLTLSYGVQPSSRAFGMGATGAFGRAAGGQPAGGAAAAAAPQAAAEEKKEEKPAQTVFGVRLDSFAAADKIKVIKEVRAATGLGLKESKELVEAAPKLVKGGLSKAESDALVAKLKEVGAKVTIE